MRLRRRREINVFFLSRKMLRTPGFFHEIPPFFHEELPSFWVILPKMKRPILLLSGCHFPHFPKEGQGGGERDLVPHNFSSL